MWILHNMKETVEVGFWLMVFIGIWSLILAKADKVWMYVVSSIFGVLIIIQGLSYIAQKLTWTFF